VLDLEGIGNVFEEDQAEDDVLVFRRVYVVADRVGVGPELGFESEICASFTWSRGFALIFAGLLPIESSTPNT
jgi:hypothetical protein